MSSDAPHSSPFDAAPPEWQQVAAGAEVVPEADPFADSAAADGSATALEDDGADPFASFGEFAVPAVSSADAAPPAAASVTLASPPPSAPAPAASAASADIDVNSEPQPLMPDSAEHIAALERRLAKLYARQAKGQHKQPYRRADAGSEFLSFGAAAALSAGMPPRSSREAASANWLDLPDSTSVAAAAGGYGNGNGHGASGGSGPRDGDSSDEESQTDAGRRRAAVPLPVSMEERVALLSRHEQRIHDEQMQQIVEASRAAATAAAGSSIHAAAASSSMAAPAASSPPPSRPPSRESISSAAGGYSFFAILAQLWYSECLSNPLLGPVLTRLEFGEEQVRLLAREWTECLGGDPQLPESSGEGYSSSPSRSMLQKHVGAHPELHAASLACLERALNDVCVPSSLPASTDPAKLRHALTEFFRWASGPMDAATLGAQEEPLHAVALGKWGWEGPITEDVSEGQQQQTDTDAETHTGNAHAEASAGKSQHGATSDARAPFTADQSASSSSTAAAPADPSVASPSRSSDTLAPSSSAPAPAAPSSAALSSSAASASASAYVLESSDGDDTSAPVHRHVPAELEGATTAGVLSHRALYYESSVQASRLAERLDESEKCVIA